MTEILATTPDDPRAAPLLDGLRAEYRRTYGDDVAGDLDAYDAAEFQPPTGTLLVLVAGGETVAGGALRRWADGTGEIKRMWTAPAHRKRGHGRRILTALEDVARGYGYRSVRLETGSLQVAAIEFYRSAGYRQIPVYGRYAGHPRCVCFEKQLLPE